MNSTPFAVSLLLAAGLAAQSAAPPLTRAERTAGNETSTCADVERFVEALAPLEFAGRLTVGTLGFSTQGRRLQLIAASHESGRSLDDIAASPRLRALIIADIHGGEVEGKEAVQELLREVALGRHDDLLQHIEILFVPVFNADGNDQIHPRNRTNQNGPDGGVGQRANAMELDLNRDFVKAESPEVQALLRAFARFDPHLFMDLHTTNGSYHGYHLTYAPSLSTNLDPDLDAFLHQGFAPRVRAQTLANHSTRVFDYGNFPRPRRGQDGPRGWTTYGHEPRYGINYYGLRNRLSMLSEAYSYLPLLERIAATKAFVLENLRALVHFEADVRRLCAAADARCLRSAGEPAQLGYASELAPPVDGEILVGSVTERELDGGGRRLIAGADYHAETMPIQVRFEAHRHLPHPEAWAVVDAPASVQRALLLHGVTVTRLDRPLRARVQQFVVDGLSRARRPFQGHRLVNLTGTLHESTFELPAGTLLVPGRQRLARVAAQLLEPLSEDSLATWNFFDGRLTRADAPATTLEELGCPVLRVLDPAPAETTALRLEDLPATPAAVPYQAAIEVRVLCLQPGTPVPTNAFESEVAWRDRAIAWQIGDERLADADTLAARLGTIATQGLPLVIRADAAITHREVADLAKAAHDAGIGQVLFVQ